MNSLNNVLKVTHDDKTAVRRFYEINEADIKRDVDILKEWIKKQPHLPQGIQDDQFFENMLIRNKCRVEKTKDCIESYYSLKTLWPEVFSGMQKVVPSTCNVRILPLPRLTGNKERILITNLRSDNPEDYNMTDFVDLGIAIAEILLKYDYSHGIRFVVDFTPMNVHFMKKILPGLLMRFITVIQHAYANRIVGLEFYKSGTWMTYFLSVIKPALPAKIFERIRVHKDANSLKEVIPEKILPKDYGGAGDSIEDLLELWDVVFQENKLLFEDAVRNVSNERLRMDKHKFNVDIFGTEGSFKKLDID